MDDSAALSASSSQLQAIVDRMSLALDAVDEAIAWTDDQGCIQWCNAAFERLTNQSVGALTAQHLATVLPLILEGGALPLLVHPVQLGLVTQQPQTGMYAFHRCDRTLRVTITVTPLPCAGNDCATKGVMVVMRDISHHKKAEQKYQRLHQELEQRVQERTAQLQQTNQQLQAEIAAHEQTEATLRRNEERFRIIFDHAPIAMSLADAHTFQMVEVNQAHYELFGYTSAELRALTYLELSHPDDAGKNQAQIQQLLDGRMTRFQLEKRFVKKNGDWIWINLSVALVCDPDGCAYTMAMLEDITDRRQTDQALRLAQFSIDRAVDPIWWVESELKSDFNAIVSHEFRNPLSAIVLFLDLLQRSHSKLTFDKTQSLLQRARSASDRLRHLLKDVLIIATVDAGKLQCELSPIDVVAFCRQVVAELLLENATAESLQATVILTYAEEPHDHTNKPSSLVNLDKNLLHHLLTNLLSNAVKCSPHDSKVQLRVRHVPEAVIFQVQDSGIGIPQSDLPYLFERFHRASNAKVISGTGLGLAIVKECVDLHGGSIDVQSTVDVGTTVTVTIPVNQAASEPA